MPAAMMLGNLGIGQLDPDFPKPFQGPPSSAPINRGSGWRSSDPFFATRPDPA
jgi:hypothetical protein